MTIGQAARIAKIHEQTIYRWIADGIIQGYGRRMCYRVSLSELLPPIESKRKTWKESNRQRGQYAKRQRKAPATVLETGPRHPGLTPDPPDRARP
jgi:excisionase family DNA binding protein